MSPSPALPGRWPPGRVDQHNADGQDQAHLGDVVAFTATVASAVGVPAGVVEFRADDVLVSTVPLVESMAVFTLKSAALGTTTVFA